MGVQDGERGNVAGSEGRAAVEARPAHPEKAGAAKHVNNVVRREMLPVVRVPGSNPVSGRETCDSGREMNDVASGVVNDVPLQESISPDGVGAHGVGQRGPQRHEQHPGVEVHSPKQ